ncbi:MAG: VOC family protein [Leptolyngbyaceae cyanobacterium]
MYQHLFYSQKGLQEDPPDEFSIAIDHLVFYAKHRREGQLLAERLNLCCTHDTILHPAQGTASQIIFFENAYLEIVHVYEEAIAAKYANRTGVNPILRKRWQESLASPFGIALCLKSESEDIPRPFTANGRSMPQTETSIYFAPDNLRRQHEPLCFIVPSTVALSTLLDLSSTAHQRLLNHPSGARRITAIKITLSQLEKRSQALRILELRGLITFNQGPSPLLELILDGGIHNQTIDCRPDFPIVITQ